MKIAIKTLGCKVNSFESEAILQIFIKNGYIQVDVDQFADVYVINTCTVTNNGDRKSRQAIRKCIKQNKDAIVCVVGCYAQLASKEIMQIPGVDIILGTKQREQLYDLVEEYKATQKPINKVSNIIKETNFEQLTIDDYKTQTRGFIKIQEGCNKFCSYCIIPYARGLMRSQDKNIILQQIKNLVSNGIKEVVLTGIHTGGYGEDLEDYTFYDLLKEINLIEDLYRVRISSIEFNQLTDEVIELINNSNKFARHLHIPIQSGSNSILKRMKREYTLEQYKAKIDQIRQLMPDISITTDLIVGFPEETNEEHLETKNTLESIKFNEIHIFPYSQREGTPAAKLKQVDDRIKKARIKEITALNDKFAKEYALKFKNKTLEIIVESKTKDNKLVGHSSNYLKVVFDGDDNQLKQVVKVKVNKSDYPINNGVIQA
ncbi:MAG: tRNA (N(6)-L-threonylcarbamoyladenosine(37)-C(2))-methylthiotransferase MtaB [Mycoplasmatales bacterium]